MAVTDHLHERIVGQPAEQGGHVAGGQRTVAADALGTAYAQTSHHASCGHLDTIPVAVHGHAQHPGHGRVTPDGVGNGVYTTTDNAPIYQCPYTFCNQGEVVNGIPSGHPDDVAAVCQLPFTSPWSNNWALVLNHANDEVGFIDRGFLRAQYGTFQPQPC